MKNLIKLIQKETDKRKNEFLSGLNEMTEVKSILDKWFYRDLIPASSKNRQWKNVAELKAYLIKRYYIRHDQRIKEELNKITSVNNAKDVKHVKIVVEWKKSAMWGNNPTAEIWVTYKDSTSDFFTSGSIGGCGYDKESTAIAKALNQCNGLLKPMYLKRNKKPNTDNREIFGYGSGYGIKPYFEGAVGTSCYYSIIESIKGKFEKQASGKTFDVYTINFK
jgi:hypothetical protein